MRGTVRGWWLTGAVLTAGIFTAGTAAEKTSMAAPAAQGRAEGATPKQEPAPADRVIRVEETKKVCMVNDRYMGVDQIPVQVEGRTYYGCCAMCKERLARDAKIRKTVDPVSGRHVDKARAVIGRAPSGKVLYFESERNLTAYIARQEKAQ